MRLQFDPSVHASLPKLEDYLMSIKLKKAFMIQTTLLDKTIFVLICS